VKRNSFFVGQKAETSGTAEASQAHTSMDSSLGDYLVLVTNRRRA